MLGTEFMRQSATRRRILASAALAILAVAAPPYANAQTLEVSEPFIGVRHFHRQTTSPRLLDIHIVEIDLATPGISALVTPSNGASSGETNLQTTRSFVTQHSLEIGINGMFFSSNSGGGYNVSGLAASNGNVYSLFEGGRTHALNITQNNIASIIRGTSPGGVYGTTHTPATTLYNAITGSERIVDNGAITAGSSDLSTALHPRSAAGVTADGKLLLMTVDGRNAGHSLGMTLAEVAATMIEFGAYRAINLDGGGSTTLVFADSTPRLVNVPVGTGPPNSERAVANNLGFHATRNYIQSTRYFFSDFEGAESNFGYDPDWSGSTSGILGTSAAALVMGQAHGGRYYQKIDIIRDPGITSTPENPDGWFVRHISGNPGAGSPGSRAANTPRATNGWVGFWAKTTTPGIETTIAIDNPSDVTADRGIILPMIADGQWHRYAWNLDDNDYWEGWANGDGSITGSTFTIDSIQFLGGSNASILLDDVFHEYLPGETYLSADFNRDGIVASDDLVFWKSAHGANVYGDASGDNRTDGADFLAWQRQVGVLPAAAAAGTQVPEPSTAPLILAALLLSRATRRR
jgi:hypothetical protein